MRKVEKMGKVEKAATTVILSVVVWMVSMCILGIILFIGDDWWERTDPYAYPLTIAIAIASVATVWFFIRRK